MKSHTQFLVVDVTSKRGEHAAHVKIILLWCNINNCSVIWSNRIAARISCVCVMFCRCSAWSRAVYEKKEWLQIGICGKCCCINAELVIRMLHSFRLLQNFFSSCDIIENLNFSLNSNQTDILRQRTRDVELKKYCVTLLEKFGSLIYTRLTMEKLDAEARVEIDKLGGNSLLENFLDKLLDWKWETGDKNKEQWVSCVVTSKRSSYVASKLICICYFDFNGCWEHDKRMWHTFVHMFVQHWHFLWCPLRVIFVTEYDSFYVKKYVNDPEMYAAHLYRNVSLFIECLEGHS